MIEASINASLLLELVLADGSTTRFPQATVYNDAGSLVATVDLAHVASGLYQGAYTPATPGHFSAIFIVYTDAGHTTVANQYDREAEHIRVVAAVEAVASTTAATGSTSTEIRTGLTQANGFFNGMLVRVSNAAGVVVTFIEEFQNTNGAIFVRPALPFTPSVGDPVTILADFVPRSGGGAS